MSVSQMRCGSLKMRCISDNFLENFGFGIIHLVCLIFKHGCLCLYTLTTGFTLDIDHHQAGYVALSKAAPLEREKQAEEEERGKEGRKKRSQFLALSVSCTPSSPRMNGFWWPKTEEYQYAPCTEKVLVDLKMSMRVKQFQSRLKMMLSFYYEKKKYTGPPFLNLTYHLFLRLYTNSDSYNAFWDHQHRMATCESAQWYAFIFYLSPDSRLQP